MSLRDIDYKIIAIKEYNNLGNNSNEQKENSGRTIQEDKAYNAIMKSAGGKIV